MVSSKKRFIYFALFLILMLSLFNSVNEVQCDEISYSQFLKLVRETKTDKAVVTECIITGVIKSEDPKESGKHFVTIPEVQCDEISYSQFLKLVRETKTDKAVVTECIITGVIKSEDPKE
ncbi:MAG: ATP-dependent metallopeptidase FtsH/Yme1/Tma family protein, partial [Methylococcaceae bacterium]